MDAFRVVREQALAALKVASRPANGSQSPTVTRARAAE
jgi:hypothetical protein